MATTLMENPVCSLTLTDDGIEITDDEEAETIAVLGEESDVDALVDVVRARYEEDFEREEDGTFDVPELSDGEMFVFGDEALLFVKDGVDPREDGVDATAVIRFPELALALSEHPSVDVGDEVLEGAAQEQLTIMLSTVASGGEVEEGESIIEPEA